MGSVRSSKSQLGHNAIDEHIAARDDVTAAAVYRAIIMQTD